MADIKHIQIGDSTYDLRDATALRESDLLAYDRLIKEYIAAQAKSVFIGTKEEYNKEYALGNIPVGCMVLITDESVSDLPTGNISSILGTAILGSMILG